MKYYYDIKYPYLLYWAEGGMYSVPPILLSKLYYAYFHKKPSTFFDCGAANGAIMQMAIDCGMDAYGVDIKQYEKSNNPHCLYITTHRVSGKKHFFNKVAFPDNRLDKLFETNKIEIKSIFDCSPIKTDLAYFNGILTYFDESILPTVLTKFKNVNMICAIHNTTEDYNIALKRGNKLGTCQKLKTVRPNKWWIDTFNKNGFYAQFNKQLHCFVAIPMKQK